MRNILQILSFSAPYKGNFIHSLENLEEAANCHDINFIYLFPESAKGLEWVQAMQSQGIRAYFITNSFFGNTIKLKNIRFIIQLIKNEQINLVHTHFIDYNYTLFITRFLIKSKVQIIGQIHNQYHLTKNYKGDLKRLVTNSIFDKIIGVGESVAKGMISEGISDRKVSFISNAIDFERLDSFEGINIRNHPDQNVILMFGWLFYIKGVDIALKAIKKVRELGHNVILAISVAGGKDNIIGEIVKMFGNVPEWLIFLEARDDVATYYNASDIFLSSSREEGLNYSVIEAAYCNPMVLESDTPGNPQDIPGVFIHKAGDFEQLTKSIIEALSISAEERKQRKILQKKFVVQKYNIKDWSEEVIKLYNLME